MLLSCCKPALLLPSGLSSCCHATATSVAVALEPLIRVFQVNYAQKLARQLQQMMPGMTTQTVKFAAA